MKTQQSEEQKEIINLSQSQTEETLSEKSEFVKNKTFKLRTIFIPTIILFGIFMNIPSLTKTKNIVFRNLKDINSNYIIEAEYKINEKDTIKFMNKNYYEAIKTLYVNGTEHKLDDIFPIGKHEVKFVFRDDLIYESISEMFRLCYKLNKVDFSNFDTSHVKNMSYLFEGNIFLKEINFGNNLFKTDSCITMSYMFGSCRDLTSLDLSAFNTNNVIDMSSMFFKCQNLKSLNLSTFNTSSVKNMSAMFHDCKSLPELDLTKFNTSSVLYMASLFFGLQVTSLDLSSFKTDSVTTMKDMFRDCNQLTLLNLSNFYTDKLLNTESMFAYDGKLKVIDLSHFNLFHDDHFVDMFFCTNSLNKVKCNDTNLNEILELQKNMTCSNSLNFIY